MTNTTDLINKINDFKTYYYQSNDSEIYHKYFEIEKDIKREVKELSHSELVELRSQITKECFFALIDTLIAELKPIEAPKQSKLSTIMSWAWALVKDGVFNNISEALRASWKRWKLVQALKSGIARFSFTKSDGSIRDAIGTLNPVNFKYESKGAAAPKNVSVVKYYDIVSNAFRSCRIDRLIRIG